MEQNNPLFTAFQQGYARRNSNNFSRDWDEFKTNHADLFQPPSPAKPSVNGELLGFLEIEIEKANKNGKDCNLKDGDLNRSQAWYSAAEAFSIVKNKITELLNTSLGHESNIINCPSCNTVWNLSRHNSCQCGATLVTKASPAKAEQEGLRWVKATMFNYTPNSRYYARWGDGDGAIKSTGWFQQSDGTFFWNENGFVPVLRKEHDQLYILDESTTPVKEAGQPAEQQYPANWGHGDYEGYVMMLQNRIKELESRQQPEGESAGVWIPFTKDARLPKNEDFLVKYDTGEIRRYQEEEQPFGIVTHYMILNDESGASTKEREIAFAEWIQRKWIPTYENNKLHSWRFFGPHDHEWYGKDYTTSQIYDLWQQSL